MKIGIITLSASDNCGSLLQTYALMNILKEKDGYYTDMKIVSKGNSKIRYDIKAQILQGKKLIDEATLFGGVVGDNNYYISKNKLPTDKIKENGGYADNDEIIVMLSLEKEALIDTYLEQFSNQYNDVSSYAESPTGQSQISKIEREQGELINQLNNSNLILSVEHCYQTIINAIAVKIKYKNFKKISQLNTVSNVIIADTFNKPQTTNDISYNVVENIVDVYETGIYKSDSVSFTGKGTSVAILDSGFDCSHEVFNRSLSDDEIAITQ